MAVHREGALTVSAGDLQIKHRDATVALKMIDWGASFPFWALVEHKLGVWSVVEIVEEFDDRSDGTPGYRFEAEADKVGGWANWIRQMLVPKINAALLRRFPPLSGTANPPPPDDGDTIGRLDQTIVAALRWAPQADGTLLVTT